MFVRIETIIKMKGPTNSLRPDLGYPPQIRIPRPDTMAGAVIIKKREKKPKIVGTGARFHAQFG
jgi:hypothetical protein